MKIQQLNIDEAFASLHSDPKGLSGVEAQRRVREFGLNAVESGRGESPVRRFLKGFGHFFAIILWIAAGIALVAERIDPGNGMATLGGAIVGVIVINNLFSFWQESRVEKAILALKKLLPRQTWAVRDGSIQSVESEYLAPGDVIRVRAGEMIPADCRVIEAFLLRVNNATVTGESMPQSRSAAPSDEADLTRARNILLAGTTILSGEGKALVFATAGKTCFGQIAGLMRETKERPSPLQTEIARVSRIIVFLATALGILFYIVGLALGLPFWANFIFAIGIIVANVPEGLLPTVTLALAMASQRMAKRNALIRHLPAVETLGSATIICTDKTGTLTQNRLSVSRVWLDGDWVDTRILSPPVPRVHFFAVAQLCRTSNDEPGQRNGDPIEAALGEFAAKYGGEAVHWQLIDEIPFDSDRRRMSTLHETGSGRILLTKGAVEAVLPLCDCMEIGGSSVRIEAETRTEISKAQERAASDGLRVMALAYRSGPSAELEAHLTLAGLVALHDPPRPEVAEAVATCVRAGVKVIMITGDHPQTAKAVAREIGLFKTERGRVITGDKLEHFSDSQLRLALDAPEILFARVAADQKRTIVRALREKGEIVAVTGDGVNDAPALKEGDIGIAMGASGTEAAREASDMILLDDNFATIVAAIEEGRAVYANVRKCLTYILTSNVPELIPFLAFVLFRIPLALTILQILAVDLGTDLLPALALGAEPPQPDAMTQPPRPRSERLLNFGLLARSYLWLGLLESAAAMGAFFFVLQQHGWTRGESLALRDPIYLEATTACLSAIIAMQIANVFICRSDRSSSFAFKRKENPLILGGIAVEVLLLLGIDYTPLGNFLFATAPLAIRTWIIMLPMAFCFMGLEELRKWIVRKSVVASSCSRGGVG